MKLFYDLRLGYLVSAPGIDTPLEELQGKAGDGAEVIVQFGRSSDPTGSSSILTAPTWTPENLAGGTVITVCIKEDGQYSDGTALASNSTWTHDAVAFTYTGAFNLNTAAINTALERDNADAGDDIASLDCGFEITFQVGGSGPWRSSELPVPFTLYHDIISGSEGTPAEASDPTEYLLKASGIEYYATVSSLTGGTAADLDYIPTTTLTAGKIVAFYDTDPVTDEVKLYKLTAGTDAESSPDVIRPDDYNASTNAKVWKLLRVYGANGISEVSSDTSPQLGGFLDCNGFAIRESKGADVASASALNLGSDGNFFNVTGTTTITSISSEGVGTQVILRFAGALTLTHHATDLILPSGANITTAAGDVAGFVEYASGDWRCTFYTRASGLPLMSPASSPAGIPSATVTYSTDQTFNEADSGKLIILDTSAGNVDMEINPASGITIHFWIMSSSVLNSGTVTRAGGANLYDSGTNGDLSLTAGEIWHLWYSTSDNWRVLAVR